jgi:hypothetical protein
MIFNQGEQEEGYTGKGDRKEKQGLDEFVGPCLNVTRSG